MWRRQGIERGGCFQSTTPLPVRMRLFDLEKKGGLTTWTTVSTKELAEDGFMIEANQVMLDGFHLFTDAMKDGRRLELEWELPTGSTLKGKGRVLWFKMAPPGSPHLFEAGVLFTELGHEQRQQWQEFTKGLLLPKL
jgi:hypothetical protein